jgi:hypothetical protein
MHRPSLAAAFVVVAVALAGCSREASLPAGNGPPSAVAGAPLSAPDVTVAGTYDGTIEEVEGSHSRSGSVVIMIEQQGTKISGKFAIKFASGKDYDLALSGSIASKTKRGAKLSITLTYGKSPSAKGSATLAGRKLSGKATAHAKSGTTIITFSAKKKKHWFLPHPRRHSGYTGSIKEAGAMISGST